MAFRRLRSQNPTATITSTKVDIRCNISTRPSRNDLCSRTA
jgi:hypothetical protein